MPEAAAAGVVIPGADQGEAADDAQERAVALRPEEKVPMVGQGAPGEDAYRRAPVGIGGGALKEGRVAASPKIVARALARFRTW